MAPNPSGVQVFARAHAWEHVVHASSKLITADQPGFNGGILSLVMKLRLEALFRTKMFDELILEATKILAAEESRLIQFFTNDEVTILECDLLIAMKLLLSEVKALMGRYEEALEQLYLLKTLLTKYSTGLWFPHYFRPIWSLLL